MPEQNNKKNRNNRETALAHIVYTGRGGDDEEGVNYPVNYPVRTSFHPRLCSFFSGSPPPPPLCLLPLSSCKLLRKVKTFSPIFSLSVPITLRIFDFAFSSHASVEFRPLYHPKLPPLLPYYSAAHETTERKHQSQIIIDVSLNTP